MQYYTEDRMRRQSNPGGRFTNTRGPDPNAIRAQQLIEAQYMAQQQQQQIRPVGGTSEFILFNSFVIVFFNSL